MNYKASSKKFVKTHNDAQIIGEYIELHFPDGVTPHQLLEVATPKSSPIHKYFDWNDESAAHKYRLDQARGIIAEIVVEVDEEPIRAFHNVYVEQDETRKYVPLEKARRSSSLWDQVIEQAYEELIFWSEKYEQYKEFAPIIKSIKTLVSKRRNENGTSKKSSSKNKTTRRSNPTHRAKKRKNNNSRNHASAR